MSLLSDVCKLETLAGSGASSHGEGSIKQEFTLSLNGAAKTPKHQRPCCAPREKKNVIGKQSELLTLAKHTSNSTDVSSADGDSTWGGTVVQEGHAQTKIAVATRHRGLSDSSTDRMLLLQVPDSPATGAVRSTCAHTASALTTSEERILRTTTESTMRRGVNADELLKGFGAIFLSSTGTVEDYQKSFPVDSLDEFISHDWHTPRWQKFVALCLHYNMRPALFLSFTELCVASLLILVLGGRSGSVDLHLAFFLGWCPFQHLLLLIYWQRIRSLCLRPKRVFLDKVCISQTDERLKTLGILSLAAFIKHSQDLVILWSPRTFTRLWCMYEYASWVNFGKDHRRIHIRPVPQAVVVAVSYFTLWMVCVSSFAFQIKSISRNHRIWFPIFAFLYLACFLGLIEASMWINRQQKTVTQLSMQLEGNFINDAACFCCSVGHKHPETQELVLCDRDLITQTLQDWYTRAREEVSILTSEISEADADRGLTHFNRVVKESLTVRASKFISWSHHMAYDMVLCLSFPFLCSSWLLLVYKPADIGIAGWFFALSSSCLLTIPNTFVSWLKLIAFAGRFNWIVARLFLLVTCALLFFSARLAHDFKAFSLQRGYRVWLACFLVAEALLGVYLHGARHFRRLKFASGETE